MNKTFYISLLVIGLSITAYSLTKWAAAGLSLTTGELSTTLMGTKPWVLNKDSYFYFVLLGVFISAYAGFELHLKRWKK